MLALTQKKPSDLWSRLVSILFESSVIQRTEEEDWSRFSDGLPCGMFLVWLANEVASALISANPQCSIDDLVLSIDLELGGSELQQHAERFLYQQYSLVDLTWRRRVRIFRRLVQHKLTRRRYFAMKTSK